MVDKKRETPRVLNKYKMHKFPYVFQRQYVGRPTKWGNPFVIGRDGTREEVIAKYEEYLLNNPGLMSELHELTGKDLVCFCAPLACHADVLVKHANNNHEVIQRAKEELERRKAEKVEESSRQIPSSFVIPVGPVYRNFGPL